MPIRRPLWKRLLNLPLSAVRFSVLPWWSVVAFLNEDTGREYSIGLAARIKLLRSVWRNASQPGCASVFFEQILIITRLLQTPPSVEGAVAEFGCYKGFSTSSLSLACKITNRRLIVFDSFEGLPAPETDVFNLDSGGKLPYEQGQFAGALEEVKNNISRFGDLSVCEFVKGYYNDTLPGRDPSEKFVLIFEDADLPESVRTVVTWTWRKLQAGCTFFCHEARDREVVGIFFDNDWWSRATGEPAPGFIGSGSGVMTGPTTDWCCLGYAIRHVAS
jgi:O-methyltransferase